MKKYDFSNHIDTYDNQAFLAQNGTYVYRMDCSENNSGFNLIVEKFNLDEQTLSTWEFPASTQPYCKSISEKGYVLGYIYNDLHYLILGDISQKQIKESEKAEFGGGKYPPIWARDQTRAILLFTLEGGEWGAAQINVQKVLDSC